MVGCDGGAAAQAANSALWAEFQRRRREDREQRSAHCISVRDLLAEAQLQRRASASKPLAESAVAKESLRDAPSPLASTCSIGSNSSSSSSSSMRQGIGMTNRASRIGGSICAGGACSSRVAGRTSVAKVTSARTQRHAVNRPAYVSAQQKQMQVQKEQQVQRQQQPQLRSTAGSKLPSVVSVSKLPTPLRCQARLPRPRQQQSDVVKRPAIKDESVVCPQQQRFDSSELISTSIHVVPDLMDSLETDCSETLCIDESNWIEKEDCFSPKAIALHKIGGLQTPQAAGSSAAAEAAAAKELERLYEGCDWRGIQAVQSPSPKAKAAFLFETPLPVGASGCCESFLEKETHIADQDSQTPEGMESSSSASCCLSKLEEERCLSKLEEERWELLGKAIASLVRAGQVTPVAATAVLAGAASLLQPKGQQQL